MYIYLNFSPFFALDDDVDDKRKMLSLFAWLLLVFLSNHHSRFSYLLLRYGTPLCILGINVINAENECHQ